MNREKKLLLIFSFNILLMSLEIGGGIFSRSLALLSDAGHMFTDSMAVFLSYLAIHWSRRPANDRKTFGYHRAEILVALINGLALLVISGYIFYEAVNRMFTPVEIKTGILLAVAVVGLAGNIAGMLLLKSETKDSLNIRSAFLHLVGDSLSSVGVIAGGIIIAFTGWNIVDSLIGMLIGGIVLRGAAALIFESADVLLESTPSDISLETLREDIENIPGINGFHEIHIWAITSGRRALSGHLLLENITTRESQLIVSSARKVLKEKYNITHTTLEVECDSCVDNACVFGNHVNEKEIENELH